jgi:hypothetical protein
VGLGHWLGHEGGDTEGFDPLAPKLPLPPAAHLDQPLADGQSEALATMLPGGVAIGLAESLQPASCLISCHADSDVIDRNLIWNG